MDRIKLMQEQYQREMACNEYRQKLYEAELEEAYLKKGTDKMTLKPEAGKVSAKVKMLADVIEKFKTQTGRTNPTFIILRNIFMEMDSYQLSYITMRYCFNSCTAHIANNSLQRQCVL